MIHEGREYIVERMVEGEWGQRGVAYPTLTDAMRMWEALRSLAKVDGRRYRVISRAIMVDVRVEADTGEDER